MFGSVAAVGCMIGVGWTVLAVVDTTGEVGSTVVDRVVVSTGVVGSTTEVVCSRVVFGSMVAGGSTLVDSVTVSTTAVGSMTEVVSSTVGVASPSVLWSTSLFGSAMVDL